MVSWLLIALTLVDWLATVILVRAALHQRRYSVPALEERATTSVLLSIGATGAGILGAGYLLGLTFPDWFSFLLLAGGLLILSVPQLVWVVAYKAGRFR